MDGSTTTSMDTSTVTSMVNGDAPVKQQHQLSRLPPTSNTTLTQERLRSYMTTRNGGGDSVTALGVRNATAESSVADRLTGVLQSVAENLVKYQNGGNSDA
ncbi:hypothetical protein F4782DRAFT_517909 [Xylaria castorea]|nr:hypothetical protein F4782DRAFT_517909 [Xylaria castorea]